ncbi:MAG TPA: ABC transporter permease [Bryobacteraceae bacterium]
MGNELRYTLRSLSRDRGFAAMVILSLAVGIGANTAIFSLIDGVLLRPPAFRDPSRLVSVSQMIPKFAKLYPAIPINVAELAEYRRVATSFESIGAMQPATFNLTGAGEPELVSGALVSANILGVLGVEPRLGRTFTENEDAEGQDSVVLIADSLWRRRFHAAPALVGRAILLNERKHVVIGVLRPEFRLPLSSQFLASSAAVTPEVFKPIGYTAKNLVLSASSFNYWAVARLRPGVTIAKALAEMNLIQANISSKMQENLDLHAGVVSIQEQMVGDVRRGLLLLMAAVGAVLLVLWVNLANLSLVRAAGRARDSAIRMALGAGRSRLVWTSLCESMTLALIGGALGVALAYWGLQALVAGAPVALPRLNEVRLDLRVLLFALAVSLGAGIILGVLPALRRAAAAPFEALKSGSRTNIEGRQGLRLRNTLVGLEVGLSAALLVTAGLLISSFVRVMTIDKGFDVERVVAVRLSLPSTRYGQGPQRIAFFDRVLNKSKVLPGVQAVGLVSALPLEGETWVNIVGVEHDPRPLMEKPSANVRFVNPGYFPTLHIPMRDGRAFQETDRGRKVAIVSASLAQRLWPGQNAIGRKVDDGESLLEVVGVTPDVRSTSLDHDPVNMLYIPYWQQVQRASSLLVRTAMDPQGIASALRAVIWDADSAVPVPEVRTMEQVLAQSVSERRFQMLLVVLFAAAALALAGFGTYGVVSYVVARRRAEMGIRMALGANKSDVLGMVLFQGMMPVVAGLLAGAVAALAVGRYLASLLFEISPRDPLAFGAACTVLLLVSAAACLIPARRATRVNPIEALRFE